MPKFSSEVIRLAQETEKKYGVPASVTLAQYALESGYGTSKLATNHNNYFGITGSYNGSYVRSGGRLWRKYSSMAESFDDHGRLLASDLYANATAGATNVSEYIDGFANIYAPASDGNNNYAGKLKQIIAENNLTQYDNGNYGGVAADLENNGVSTGVQSFGFLGGIISIISMVFLIVLAVVFFLKAFDIGLPTKKNIVEKVVSE